MRILLLLLAFALAGCVEDPKASTPKKAAQAPTQTVKPVSVSPGLSTCPNCPLPTP